MQTEVFVASMIYWAMVTMLLLWITKSIRDIKTNLKNIEHRVEINDEN